MRIDLERSFTHERKRPKTNPPTSREKNKKTLKNDKIKNIFCIKQGKKLIRINKLKEIEEKITGALNEQQDKQ